MSITDTRYNSINLFILQVKSCINWLNRNESILHERCSFPWLVVHKGEYSVGKIFLWQSYVTMTQPANCMLILFEPSGIRFVVHV